MRSIVISVCACLLSFATSAAPPNKKAGLEFFDMIYCINLPKCTDRKQHMIEEFNRVGIKNYKFLVATTEDSEEVAQLFKSGFVAKYPPCFRCHKKFCNCKTNVLIKPQVGNWSSYINLFKDMLKNNYEYVLITEDDIKFIDNAPEIMQKLINQKTFAEYKIDPEKPLLIRFTGKNEPGELKDKYFMHRFKRYSNPCFMVNRKFAEMFFKHLTHIYHTSDEYIHFILPMSDPNIQDFTINPQLAHELSSGQRVSGLEAKFNSTIRPKGDNEYAKTRRKLNKERIEYWEYLLNKVTFWRKKEY